MSYKELSGKYEFAPSTIASRIQLSKKQKKELLQIIIQKLVHKGNSIFWIYNNR